eukprot:5802421-Pyramimonas_sp.AAC.2
MAVGRSACLNLGARANSTVRCARIWRFAISLWRPPWPSSGPHRGFLRALPGRAGAHFGFFKHAKSLQLGQHRGPRGWRGGGTLRERPKASTVESAYFGRVAPEGGG